jgi:hypothetical protein
MNSIASRDLHWSEDGYAAISGALLAWLQKLDRRFLDWADELGAQEHRFPSGDCRRKPGTDRVFRFFSRTSRPLRVAGLVMMRPCGPLPRDADDVGSRDCWTHQGTC